jgi:hypothetical protein
VGFNICAWNINHFQDFQISIPNLMSEINYKAQLLIPLKIFQLVTSPVTEITRWRLCPHFAFISALIPPYFMTLWATKAVVWCNHGSTGTVSALKKSLATHREDSLLSKNRYTLVSISKQKIIINEKWKNIFN